MSASAATALSPVPAEEQEQPVSSAAAAQSAATQAAMVQIRNMPDSMHRMLKAKAVMEGKTLSEYLIDQLRDCAEKPTLQEWTQQLRQQQSAKRTIATANAADIVRQMRGE
jgi:plasmid stability protein